MLGITGIIVVVIQFLIDGYAISRGNMMFHSFLDVFGHYIFGIVGIILFFLERAAYVRKARILSSNLKKAKRRLRGYEE